jgi:hypothetical protein
MAGVSSPGIIQIDFLFMILGLIHGKLDPGFERAFVRAVRRIYI